MGRGRKGLYALSYLPGKDERIWIGLCWVFRMNRGLSRKFCPELSHFQERKENG